MPTSKNIADNETASWASFDPFFRSQDSPSYRVLLQSITLLWKRFSVFLMQKQWQCPGKERGIEVFLNAISINSIWILKYLQENPFWFPPLSFITTTLSLHGFVLANVNFELSFEMASISTQGKLCNAQNQELLPPFNIFWDRTLVQSNCSSLNYSCPWTCRVWVSGQTLHCSSVCSKFSFLQLVIPSFLEVFVLV